MNKIKNFLYSYLGEFALYVTLFIITGTLAGLSTNIFLSIPFWIICLLGVLYTLIGIAYAWIINPINAWKAKRANKSNEL